MGITTEQLVEGHEEPVNIVAYRAGKVDKMCNSSLAVEATATVDGVAGSERVLMTEDTVQEGLILMQRLDQGSSEGSGEHPVDDAAEPGSGGRPSAASGSAGSVGPEPAICGECGEPFTGVTTNVECPLCQRTVHPSCTRPRPMRLIGEAFQIHENPVRSTFWWQVVTLGQTGQHGELTAVCHKCCRELMDVYYYEKAYRNKKRQQMRARHFQEERKALQTMQQMVDKDENEMLDSVIMSIEEAEFPSHGEVVGPTVDLTGDQTPEAADGGDATETTNVTGAAPDEEAADVEGEESESEVGGPEPGECPGCWFAQTLQSTQLDDRWEQAGHTCGEEDAVFTD